ncbi:hypothetical protein [Streptomyces sp. NPDC016845]|uniref:hypothetical protein n=1 Tax=Streptomyces sp. NPDC016845 TaxID=3364972 RepID=UPI0037B0F6FF
MRPRARYALQWLWFPPLWVLWLVPWLVLVFLYFVFLPFTFLWDLDLPGFPGSGRRLRTRRRMWLNRKRMRWECSTDLPWLEDGLRTLFDNRSPVLEGRRSSGTTWRHRDGRIEVDDSYYRQLGVARAVQIAQEHGYEADVRDAPKWLVFRYRTA